MQIPERESTLLKDYIHREYNYVKSLPLNPSYSEEKNAVIVEPRSGLMTELDFVIKNVLHFLGPEWGLYIFYGSNNQELIENAYADKQIHLINLDTPNLSPSQHNYLLTQKFFWNTIKSEKIFIFQTDSFLRRKGIEEFMKYDYIGAPWFDSSPNNPMDYSGGNGGLSLRSKKAMLDCIQQFAYPPNLPEDIFFTHSLYHLKNPNVPPREVAKSFSVETVFHPDPLGLHRPDIWLTDEEVLSLLNINYEDPARKKAPQPSS